MIKKPLRVSFIFLMSTCCLKILEFGHNSGILATMYIFSHLKHFALCFLPGKDHFIMRKWRCQVILDSLAEKKLSISKHNFLSLLKNKNYQQNYGIMAIFWNFGTGTYIFPHLAGLMTHRAESFSPGRC